MVSVRVRVKVRVRLLGLELLPTSASRQSVSVPYSSWRSPG